MAAREPCASAREMALSRVIAGSDACCARARAELANSIAAHAIARAAVIAAEWNDRPWPDGIVRTMRPKAVTAITRPESAGGAHGALALSSL